MMKLTFKPCMAVAMALLTLSGCASVNREDIPAGASPDSIYDQVYKEGQSNTIELLREGLQERKVYGVTDPYIPLRRPDEVVPIWVVDGVDPLTGRRIGGHWEHTVIRRGGWAVD